MELLMLLIQQYGVYAVIVCAIITASYHWWPQFLKDFVNRFVKSFMEFYKSMEKKK